MKHRASTAEVCEAAGISRSTLNRWVRRGIMPEPRRWSDGTRVVAYYPANAPDRAATIATLRDRGMTFDEIEGALSAGIYRHLDPDFDG